MSANSVVLSLTLENCIKITKWKVKEGTLVSVGRIILLYDPSPGYGKPQVQKLKATAVGTVRKLLVKEGDVIQPGYGLLHGIPYFLRLLTLSRRNCNILGLFYDYILAGLLLFHSLR